jgi:hypothetical protein
LPEHARVVHGEDWCCCTQADFWSMGTDCDGAPNGHQNEMAPALAPIPVLVHLVCFPCPMGRVDAVAPMAAMGVLPVCWYWGGIFCTPSEVVCPEVVLKGVSGSLLVSGVIYLGIHTICPSHPYCLLWPSPRHHVTWLWQIIWCQKSYLLSKLLVCSSHGPSPKVSAAGFGSMSAAARAARALSRIWASPDFPGLP